MDFAERWNDKDLGLKRLKGNCTLLFLTNYALKGLENHIRYPWFQVCHVSFQCKLCMIAHTLAQYLHPLEAKEYREVIRALRLIGEDCIKKRIHMVESGEPAPNDILTHILQIACEYVTIVYLAYYG